MTPWWVLGADKKGVEGRVLGLEMLGAACWIPRAEMLGAGGQRLKQWMKAQLVHAGAGGGWWLGANSRLQDAWQVLTPQSPHCLRCTNPFKK